MEGIPVGDDVVPIKGDAIGVGSPEIMLLEDWAYRLRMAFDEVAYLVGTAARSKTFRDVDIRIMLDDEGYERLLGKRERPARFNHTFAVICTALSVWGRQQTGLPIDFQFQTMTEANEQFGGGVRIPLIAAAVTSHG